MTALYWLLGWPIFAGVSATIIFIPLNLIFVRKTEKWTEELMKTKDERVRLLSENLQAMKTVKFFAWEKSVEEKVTEIRDKEVQQLRKVRYVRSDPKNFFKSTPLFSHSIIMRAIYV
jgi:ABC-type bacteriocin/lantibiotic exporter with double-glycine peptidase domain